MLFHAPSSTIWHAFFFMRVNSWASNRFNFRAYSVNWFRDFFVPMLHLVSPCIIKLPLRSYGELVTIVVDHDVFAEYHNLTLVAEQAGDLFKWQT